MKKLISDFKPWALILAASPLMAVGMLLMMAFIPCCMYAISRVVLSIVSLFH